jgi:hypothetical protein
LASRRWLWILPLACLFLAGCDKNKPKKPDPTKGRVTGIVLCADTGKPARFATVTLSAAPKKDQKSDEANPLPDTETTVTDLDGRFSLEAVEPGVYYAYATLEGYLDPMRGLDFSRLDEIATGREQELDAIKQWKDHLVEASVHAHRTSELSLQVERGAEIAGTVTYEDGNPAIGVRFQLTRKTEKNGWTEVGLPLFTDWSLPVVSDGHGRYSLTNLPAGEYSVCALMPTESQNSAAHVCLGNKFRKKDAATVKVKAGEIAGGADIEIPLSGLHLLAGTVSALADGHPLAKGTVQLLYADDREKTREMALQEDGSFSFAYVPEGNYILKVSGAQDAEQKDSPPAPADADATAQKPAVPRHYADKELPVIVLGEVNDLQLQLVPVPTDQPRNQ